MTKDELLNEYQAKTSTIRNDVELKIYDSYLVFIERLKKYFESAKNYKGYPMLPEWWLDRDYFIKYASETEKQFISHITFTLFMEALRHWKADKDMMYPGDHTTPFYLE